jgi:hypothetical protein
VGKLRGGPGDETWSIAGRLGLPPGLAGASLLPEETGLQLQVVDLGDGERRVLDFTAGATPIPPGAPGTGCGPKDGWTNLAYRNRSNALDASCSAGSAQGLRTVRLKDRRAKGKGIAFRIVGKGAEIAAPAGPLAMTLVLGADEAAGRAGACAARAFDADACRIRRGGFACR